MTVFEFLVGSDKFDWVNSVCEVFFMLMIGRVAEEEGSLSRFRGESGRKGRREELSKTLQGREQVIR